MRKLYVIPADAEPVDHADAARGAGATEVVAGVPASLAGLVATADLPAYVETDHAPAMLTADRHQLAADGTDAVVVTYWNEQPDAPATVTFDVNGAQATEDLVDATAAVEVTADAPGPITVSCEGRTLQLEAQEAPV